MHLKISSVKRRPSCSGGYESKEGLLNVTVYHKEYAHGFVVLCFVVVMQSFIMNSHEVFIHIHQGCFAGTGAIVRLPECQWSKPDGYGKISQCITTTKHSKAKTVCIFLGIYCMSAALCAPVRFEEKKHKKRYHITKKLCEKNGAFYISICKQLRTKQRDYIVC